MTRSDHDNVLKLDNTELLLWPKWVESIPPHIKVATVKKYRGWQVRNRPGGLVWHEHRVDNDEKRFGKYGQTVRVTAVHK